MKLFVFSMGLNLKVLDEEFSVCKIQNIKDVNWDDSFIFLSKTDDELSLVCRTQNLPENHLEVENGWRGMKVFGILEFSLVGILSKISGILAERKISLFAISTFNTDYVLVKESNLENAICALKENGYTFSQ